MKAISPKFFQKKKKKKSFFFFWSFFFLLIKENPPCYLFLMFRNFYASKNDSLEEYSSATDSNEFYLF